MRVSFRKKVVMAFAAVLTLATSVARAQADGEGCSDATLTGSYGFRVSGQIFGPNGAVTVRDGVATTSFDGRGGLSQADFVMSNGVPLSGPTDPVTGFHIDETGTYHVNSDCTGSAEIDLPAPPGSTGAVIKLMFVLSDQGRNVHTIVSELIPPGSTQPAPVSIHSDGEKLVSPRLHAPTALSSEAAPSRNLVWTPPDNLTSGDAVTYNLSLTGGTGTCASGCLFHPGAPSWYSIGPSAGSGSFTWTLQAVSASRPYAAPVAGPGFTLQ
ncbi:MAG TPA: hypothetical protein VMN04_13640 [Thermoanaerobaculia bacterium]|nr:hypothetical protein [Thermoanaerobaculia bacterium]